jgi:uncharacterized DUF497 family protein
LPDSAHSKAEERLKAIGRSDKGRYILIVFTLRRLKNETFIRPISAHKKEADHYEEEVAKIKER